MNKTHLDSLGMADSMSSTAGTLIPENPLNGQRPSESGNLRNDAINVVGNSQLTTLKCIGVVAVAENGVIGCNGELPWRLATDLRRFRDLTTGHPIIIGRRTFQSIGRPLPNRVSIVLSRDQNWQAENENGNVKVVRSFGEAIRIATRVAASSSNEAYVVGGGEIYRLALPHIDRLHVTRVHTEIEGDATFPKLDPNEWQLIESESHVADEKNDFDVTFEVWERISNQSNRHG